MTLRENLTHDVKSFLRRPINIHSGLWDTTAAAGTQLYTANFPETLISNPMYQEKLRGFVGLRATLVLQVQVNSQLFQQGNLMLQYIPYAQYLGPDRVGIVNSSLAGRSGCPRSDLNIAVGTEINMRIPFVSPNLFFNLITGQGSFGSVYLVVYSPLFDEASGTGSIEYTIWAHLEDVEVEYPTGAEIFTGNEPNRFHLSNKLLHGNDQSDLDLAQPAKIYAQIMPELMAMKDSGMISSTFGTLSDGLNTLSDLPVIGKFLQAPSWISSQISNIAQLFGFSKPTSQSHACETKLRGQARMANYNGVDMSHKLALSANNEIETRNGLAGTSVDEMAISTLASIPNFWQRFTWDTESTTGQQIYSDLVTANRFLPDSSGGTGVYTTTHMGFLANVHTYWRGSIVYTFKFMKTKFHSGRLRIIFTPYHYGGTDRPIGGTLDVSKCYQTVVDLRESTEVTFTVPYVSSRPWMFTTRPDAPWLTNGTVSDYYNYNIGTGMIRVEVLNKLVAAANVHQSIDVIVEVSGGQDMTFAGPTAPSLSIWGEDVGEGKIVAQVMGENEVIQRNEAQLGNAPPTISDQPIKANWSPEALCIGEKIMSVRQLIKRFSSQGAIMLTSAMPDVLVSPFSVASPDRDKDVPYNYTGMFEYFYFIYAFFRGGMRLKAHYNVESAAQVLGGEKYHNFIRAGLYSSVGDQWNNIVTNNFSNIVGTASAVFQRTGLTDQLLAAGQSIQVIDPELEGVVELEVPYYNISHLTPTSMTLVGEKPISAENVWRGLVPPSFATLSPVGGLKTDTNYRFELYRACSDDFSFLYTLGVPRLIVPPLPTPTPPESTRVVDSSIYTVD